MLSGDKNQTSNAIYKEIKILKFFHSEVRGRRKHPHIHRINHDKWIEGYEGISDLAVEFYKNLFYQDDNTLDLSILDPIPKIIENTDNENLLAAHVMQEVKDAVFDITPNSSAGSDRFSGMFFHKAWDIVATDMVNMVKFVLNREQLPKFFTNTCMFLLPKVESPQTFSKFKPTSVSNVT